MRLNETIVDILLDYYNEILLTTPEVEDALVRSCSKRELVEFIVELYNRDAIVNHDLQNI